MKRIIGIWTIVLCLSMFSIVFAEEELTDENMFGKPIEFTQFGEYSGDVQIDEVFIYQEEQSYIITLKYSNGQLITNDEGALKTSFFNPPNGSVIKISGYNAPDKVNHKGHIIQYTADKEAFRTIEGITIFLYDVNHDNDDENISVHFSLKSFDFSDVPDKGALYSGYTGTSQNLETNLSATPSSWAAKSIEELRLEGLLKDEAFEGLTESITREQFVYLMVNLYEALTEDSIVIDPAVTFSDTEQVHVLKAATLGITTGIGNGQFGPDIVINREQMTTFLIKTLQLAKVSIKSSDMSVLFADDETISSWAKTFVYAAKVNNIMGGTGQNMFSPKVEATNEQALFITHNLLKKHGALTWFNEYNADRLYLKFDDELYKLPILNTMYVSENDENVTLYLEAFDDIEVVLNALQLQSKHVAYISSTNPNVKGILEPYDYKKMKVTAENIYAGVDKSGEKNKIDVGNGQFVAEVKRNTDGLYYGYKNFDLIKYYDLEGHRLERYCLPIEEMAKALDVNFKVTFNTIWKIYVIEVSEK